MMIGCCKSAATGFCRLFQPSSMLHVSDHGVNLGSFSSMRSQGIVVHQSRLRCMRPESDASKTIGAIASGVVSSRRFSRTDGRGTTFSKTVSMGMSRKRLRS